MREEGAAPHVACSKCVSSLSTSLDESATALEHGPARHHGLVTDSSYLARQLEADLLAEIGRCLHAQDLRVRVRLPAPLAAQAVAGWEREDVDELAENETTEQRALRLHAGALALIGLAVKERGTPDGYDGVIVDLDAWQIGNALDAADARGLLNPPNRPDEDT